MAVEIYYRVRSIAAAFDTSSDGINWTEARELPGNFRDSRFLGKANVFTRYNEVFNSLFNFGYFRSKELNIFSY